MSAIARNRGTGLNTGFVPTMGYLHEGHLSLVRRSNESCGETVVSIFVNPSQFGATEDLGSYPRDLERDIQLLSQYEVNYLFCPASGEMYPPGYRTWIEVEGLSSILCGASRPGHFKGVATIVMKLVNIVKPQRMFMGLKDYQQTVVLQRMLKDLNSEAEIVPCPIVREADGLALSSRNSYLSAEQRKQALCLSQALEEAKRLYRKGIRDSRTLIGRAGEIIAETGGKADYVKIVHGATLEEVDAAAEGSRMLLAVFIGGTRLIDNDALSA
jgi:pantoate--beta-alanine ligase